MEPVGAWAASMVTRARARARPLPGQASGQGAGEARDAGRGASRGDRERLTTWAPVVRFQVASEVWVASSAYSRLVAVE